MDPNSNKCKGLTVLNPDKNAELFTAIDNSLTPEYMMNLMRVFNEEFIAENSKKDLGPIIDLVEKQDWLTLMKANPVFHKIYAIYPLLNQAVFYMTTDWLSRRN